MGIRFFCPNGHKLHVKAFLAGKRGYCPKCGIKLLIPETSAATLAKAPDVVPGTESHSSERHGAEPQAADPNGTAAKTQSADLLPRRMERRHEIKLHERPSQQPRDEAALHPGSVPDEQAMEQLGAAEMDIADEGSPSGVGHGGEVRPDSVMDARDLMEARDADHPAAPVGTEALVAAQDAVWYVRPPSGGQYGPATPQEIDRWSAEGRIPGESLVWREGWEDWRTASEALQGAASAAPVDWPNDLADQAVPRNEAPQGYQRQKKKKQTTIVFLLSMACVVLLVLFLWVVKPWSA